MSGEQNTTFWRNGLEQAGFDLKKGDVGFLIRGNVSQVGTPTVSAYIHKTCTSCHGPIHEVVKVVQPAAAAGARFVYAFGKLVVWVPRGTVSVTAGSGRWW